MNLFRYGRFLAASGRQLDFKIECDVLGDDDWATIAAVGAQQLPPFGFVFGVPRGGLKLATAMMPYRESGSLNVLIVDDVWTTGGSMLAEASKHSSEWVGYVAFARGPLIPRVKAFMGTEEAFR